MPLPGVRFLPTLAAAALVALVPGCATTTADPSAPPPPGLAVEPAATDAFRDRPDSTAASAPDLAEDPTLGDLLRAALDRSPRILAAREQALAAAESPAVEGALPDPQVMVGWYDESVETRVGPQRWSVSLQQRVPFPTKLGTRSDMAEVDARRMAVAYERTVRDVLVAVVKSAHEIAYLDEAWAITADVEALLERYSAAAAGDEDALLPELFRAETQRAQLAHDRITLEELRTVESEHLAALLALPRGARIGTPRLPRTPDVDASFDELLAVADAHSQELREAGLRLEAARLGTSLARQSRAPDLMVGVTRIATDRLDPALGMNPPDNGKDPLILQAGVTLPIWVGRDEAAIRRAAALERAAALGSADAAQSVRDRLARAWFAVGNAERLTRLYDEVLVPRAAAAARTAEDLDAAGKGSLGGTLETIAVWHGFRLAAARARADLGRAVADLEAVLGRPFDSAPGQEVAR